MEQGQDDFTSFLNSRRAKKSKHLSVSERHLLRDAVFQLVTYHSSADSVVHEAKGIKLEDSSPTPVFLQDILKTCIRSDKSEGGTSFMVVENVAAKLLHIAQNQSGKQIFSHSEKVDIQAHISCLSSTIQEQSFQKPRLLNLLCKEKCLPILYLWCLHMEEIMTIGSYLTYKSNDAGFVPTIAESMIAYLQGLKIKDDSTDASMNNSRLWNDSAIFKDYFHQFINFAFTEQIDSKACKKVSKAVLEQFITKMLDLLTRRSVTCSITIPDLISGCPADMAKKFCAFSIQTMLGYKPVYKVADALSSKDWTFAKLETYFTEWLKMMLLPFDPVNVLDLIKQVLEHQEINWHLVLTFLSTLLICLPDVSTPLQDYIQDSLRSGLENSNIEELVIGFLFARQACSEGSHVFMTYADWFQRLFGDSSRSPASSRKTFSALIKFLTDIVPFDQPQYLKVHILRPPFVPPKCRELLSDYLLLAKTRLSDLKQPIENDGMFVDTSSLSTDQDLTNQVEGDVQKALSAYSVNRKIPSAVMEASIFRKPYFIGKFLPVLLKPRPLPDIPDQRMNFIEALKKIEKIPANLYNTYTEKCKAEAARLLEGAFPEEEGYDDMELSPLDQLSSRLENLLSVVKSSKRDISEAVALIRERLLSLCEEEGSNTTLMPEEVVDIDLHSAKLSNKLLKICDILLNFFCKATLTMQDTKTPSYHWTVYLVDIITEIDVLYKSLLCRLWTLVIHQGCELDGNHTRGLACLLVHMLLKQKCLTPVRVTCPREQCQPFVGIFQYLLWEHLPFYTSQWMMFALRLTSEYVSTALQALTSKQLTEHKEQILPSTLCKLFLYLCSRLLLNKHHTGHIIMDKGLEVQSVLQLAHTLYRSEKVDELLQNQELTLEEWLSYELNVSTEEDVLCLSDRELYIHDTIYNTYLRDTRHNITNVCSTFLIHLVKTDLMCLTKQQEIHVVCQQCSANHRPYRYHRNRPAFISLLQELCCMLPSAECNKDGHPPWLIGQLRSVIDTSEKELSALEKQTSVQAFMRVAHCLPSYLFYCDNLQMESLTAYRFTDSVYAINTTMKNSLCEGNSLTVSDTLYFLKGISQLNTGTSAETAILQDCPLLVLSSLVHHKHAGQFLKKIAEKDDRRSLNEMIVAVNFMEGISTRPGEIIELPDLKSVWIKAGILIAILSLGYTESLRKSYDHVLHQLLNSCEKETDIQTLFVVLLSHVSVSLLKDNILLDKTDGDFNLVMMMMRKYQSVCVEALDQSFLDKVGTSIPDYVLRLLPCTMLRILRISGDSVVLPSHLNHVLSLYSQVTELLDTALLHHENQKSVFSMQELIEVNVYVKELIKKSRTAELQRIDKSLLKRCGIDVAMEFTKMMKMSSR